MSRLRAQEEIDWLASDRGPAPRIAVVFAHPDDETIGTGARLPRLGAALFVCVTDGSPRDPADARSAGFATREAYATARQEELSTVFRLAAIEPAVRHLGFIDQEASLHLMELSRRLATVLREAEIDAVITHPYEGGHPDHDATAFAVHAACELLRRETERAPLIIEMGSYHGNAGTMVPMRFPPYCRDALYGLEFTLSDAERRLKARLFDAYRTQRAVLKSFPLDVERFRLAPKYDFKQAPHPGRLFYENFKWGIDGSRWRNLATVALDELEIAPEVASLRSEQRASRRGADAAGGAS